ncbi:non-hydrolyzing UDP-N-acetylglucosamine 2-epimerase [Sinomonas sp. P47F7]|uniref:non-hydrolyzing UDP-N-acetylglucosamine 2-epimerase n=1 Tax=Sinomonas sp. P47F7 TaxID=3410987 RepID=UPI003BF5F643
MAVVMPIYGTRPEAIKMAPIVQALGKERDISCFVTVTGQHREMLDQVNSLFGIDPDVDLNILRPGQSLSGILSRTVDGLDELFGRIQPDVVLVQGDTTSAAAGALTAFYHKIPVVHVEAGLRSGNLLSPFPEEANRKLISQIAQLHLAPTHSSKRNLLEEGISDVDIAVTGNTVIDALLQAVEMDLPVADPRIEEAVQSGQTIVLATTHRRENQGGSMEAIGRALARIAEADNDSIVILPAHRNPVVREAVLPWLANVPNVLVCEPLSYHEFARVMRASRIVVTDSGGVQEEAPSLGKPVLVMRQNTERPEAVTAGTVKLIGTDEDRIVHEALKLLQVPSEYEAMANAVNPYGDGRAAERSISAILHLLGRGRRLPDFAPIIG